jgi:hypothetical protein
VAAACLPPPSRHEPRWTVAERAASLPPCLSNRPLSPSNRPPNPDPSSLALAPPLPTPPLLPPNPPNTRPPQQLEEYLEGREAAVDVVMGGGAPAFAAVNDFWKAREPWWAGGGAGSRGEAGFAQRGGAGGAPRWHGGAGGGEGGG